MALGSSEGGSGASAGAVRAGGAFVEISGSDSLLKSALESAKARVEAFGKHIQSVGKRTAAIGSAIAAPLTKQFWATVSHDAEIDKLQRKFGGTTEDMSKLAYAFKTTGVDVDEFTKLVSHLQKSISGEAAGQGGVLAEIGLDAKKLLNMPLEEQILTISREMVRLKHSSDATADAMHLFGKTGQEALALLKEGPAGIKKRMQEAEEMGAVVSGEHAKMARNIKRTWGQIENAIHYAVMSIGEALLPAGDQVANYAKQFVFMIQSARGWIHEHRVMIQLIAAFGVGLIVAGTALSVFGGLLSKVFLPFTIAIKIAVAALGLLFSPIGLIVAAIGGLTAVWITQTASGQAFSDRICALFGEIAKTAKDAWGGIVEAIKAGDMELAFEIGAKGIRVLWLEMVGFLEKEWNNFKSGWMKGLGEMVIAARSALLAMAGKDKNDIMGAVAGGYLGFRVGRMFGPVGAVIGTALGAAGGIIIQEVAAAEEKLEAELKARGLQKPGPVGDIGGALNELEQAKKDLQDAINKGIRKRAMPPGANAVDPLAASMLGGAGILVNSRPNAMADHLEMERKLAAADRAAKTLPIDYAKGLFQSPNFAQALGIGDHRTKIQEKIADNTGEALTILLQIATGIKNVPFGKFK